ncbi:MAG: RluA family pseudouridine synthase [Gammaproteobacteria bacterium]|nr:RluA family pseudouridine synthase [Gammaproteobacteria bacterium]
MNQNQPTPRPAVREVVVDPAFAGQRVDNFLRNELKGVPKSRIYRILRKGEVRVNRGRIKPDYRLQAGDVIRIPPVRQATPSEKDEGLGRAHGRRLATRTLLEDDDIWVLDKPAGMAVHGGSGQSLGVIESARMMRPELPYLELVHRLDRDTSGCLILAKRRSALKFLHDTLRAGGMDKTYVALVKGRFAPGRTMVDAPLLKNQLRSGERMVRVDAAGKASRSVFEGLAAGSAASLVRVTLLTGRTHQIRVHGAHLGHPLAGDEKYGDHAFNEMIREHGLKRLFLHAWRLRIPTRLGGEVEVTAPLPADLTEILKVLELECALS